jgi:glutamate--cysteine ligase
VPKERYAILADHIRESGRLGRHMMKLTASSQFSLDTPGDRGLGEQIDGALRLLPLLAGWLANAPVSRGRKGRWKTLRPEIWRRTDRSRCGLPNFLFKPQPDPLGAWAHYYLGREALFFVRRGRWFRGDGRSFRAWLREPGPLAPMTMDDWTLHLSSCFPDLRFRGYLELRTADSVPLPLLLGAAGLCVGLLGDPARVRAWRGLLPDPDPARTRFDILGAAVGGGDWVPPAGPSPREAAPALFRKAAEGLRALGEDPGWLEPLERSARSGSCPADGWRRVPGIGWRGPEALAGAAP